MGQYNRIRAECLHICCHIYPFQPAPAVKERLQQKYALGLFLGRGPITRRFSARSVSARRCTRVRFRAGRFGALMRMGYFLPILLFSRLGTQGRFVLLLDWYPTFQTKVTTLLQTSQYLILSDIYA